jgi:hypothetical protein
MKITYVPLATPSIVTTPSASTVAIGTTLQDSATLTGNATLDGTGSITFNLYGPGDPTCSSTLLDSETVADVSGTGPWSTTNGFEAIEPGTYNWTASFTGDGNNNAATEVCGAEQVTVGRATPSMGTTVLDGSTQAPWTGSEVTGADASDTATVTGVPGITPTGTVTYDLFANASCSGVPLSNQTVVLALGTVPDSAATPALAEGAYGFQATYSGDANYTGATGSCESFRVGAGSTGVSTAVNDAATNLAWSGTEGAGATAFDTATLHHQGSIPPTGGVTYSFFDGRTCSGTPVSTKTVQVGAGGEVPNSQLTTRLAVGAYGFQATYSGDSNYTSATGPCEPFSVSPVNVLHVSPNSGPHTGGTKITITGTGFAPGAVVKLGQGHGAGPGSLTATKVTVVSSGKITAVTPKGAKPGTWNVFVIEPGSVQSPPHPADRFTYT